MRTPTSGPCCPNHGEPLEGIGFPMPQKGTGICPVSKVPFAFSIDADSERVGKDKNGNITKNLDWKVDGDGVKE